MNQKMTIWIYMIKLIVPLQQQRLLPVNETLTVSQTPTVSSCKVEDIEKESPKRKESISGNRIINVKYA